MRRAKASNEVKITREEADLERVLLALPDNPFPWATAITLIAPIVARLAARLVLKKIDRGMSEDRVNTITAGIASTIRDILAKRGTPNG